jgi:ABC-2 type transport system ATP-binding protein
MSEPLATLVTGATLAAATRDTALGGASQAVAEFRNVSKWYGPVIGVNDVSVALPAGITGLLGPNGAGKTTLLRLLAGQLRPSLGTVLVRGWPAWSASAKAHIGYCPDVDAFYEEMPGREFVRTMARLHGFCRRSARRRAEEVLHEVGMAHRADRKLRGYSKGMRQRIKLAQALVHDPDLIVVDEPLNGVDPVGRRELMDLFHALAARGKSLLISSHILDEMETLADRVLFMGRGRVLAAGTLPEIRDMLDNHPLRVRIRSDRARDLASRLVRWEWVRGIELRGSADLHLQVHRPGEFFRQFAELVLEEAFEIDRLQTTDASAGAIFDYVMQESARF